MALNLYPLTNVEQPTSHVRIGRSKVGTADVVRVKHNNVPAFFYVDPVDDRVINEIRNNVKLHDNVTDLFGGIERGEPFQIDTDVSLRNVAPCESAELFTTDVDEDRLEAHLRANDYLLHPIDEVTTVDGSNVEFTVAGMRPERHTTLRVTDDTEIEFVDAAPDAGAGAVGGPAGGPAPGGRGGGGGGGGAPGAEEDEVDIDLTPETPTVSFEEDVAGLADVKRTARMLLALFDPGVREEVERRYGSEFVGRGGSMLLYGPPGCGKTLVSEAIAYEAKHNTNIEEEYGTVQFLSVKGGDILSRYPGEAERRVEAVFDQAHGIAQEGFAVLFFDEVETLIPDRSDDGLQRHERSLTNAFLQAMNDVEDNLLVIGATNMPFTIDPAATRRFPIQQFIPQPDEAVMADVWRKQLAPLEAADGVGASIDYDRLAAESIGYTPAEIADRILGTELQRDLVGSVVDEDRAPVEPDTEFLLERLRANEPKTVRQYITSVRDEVDRLEGYPEMRRYVEGQAEELGIAIGGGGGALAELLSGGDGDAPAGNGEGGDADAPVEDSDVGAEGASTTEPGEAEAIDPTEPGRPDDPDGTAGPEGE